MQIEENMRPDSQYVIKEEKEYLSLSSENGKGIAISGGGIRSASFGLGVIQAFVTYDKMKQFDYMSTVSGGGYIGSALTWALYKGEGRYGTSPNNFPLGKKGVSSKGTNAGSEYLSNSFLDFMRQHSSYLMPTRKLGLFSFIGVVLRSILLSLLIYFGMLLCVVTVMEGLGLFKMSLVPEFKFKGYNVAVPGVFFPLSFVCLIVFLVITIWSSIRSFFKEPEGKRSKYGAFIQGQVFIGIILKVAFASLLLGLLPFLETMLGVFEKKLAAATISSLVGTATGVWQYAKAQKNDQSSGILNDLLVYLGAFFLIYGLILAAFLGGQTFFLKDSEFHNLGALIITAASVLVLSVLSNLNIVGPHRIWRNRLMEAFLPEDKAVEDNIWTPAISANSAKMHKMCEGVNRRPYHIINTNVILTHSSQVKYNGRGGDNFIISPKFCGSDSTRYERTKTFNTGGNGITLATAMATSAAALNPNAAVSGAGMTRNTVVSILLSVLNLRLGCWVDNPSKEPGVLPPNFVYPGLTHEILRGGFTELNHKILLSDGGHFENLGIYELIRRKLSLIVLSDGGADAEFNFDDLANAVEKVRVDFGAKIVFREKFGLDNLLQEADIASAFYKKYSVRSQGFAVADIFYEDGTSGVLVYIKLALIKELPADIYSYKGVNPAFPHQPTSDQFFDEKQFEAYRELGYQIATGFLKSAISKDIQF